MAESLRKYFYRSLTFHTALLGLLILSPYFSFGHRRFRDEKITWVELSRGPGETLGQAIQKAKGLPKTTIEEQKKEIEEAPAKPKTPSMTYESKQKEKTIPQAKKKPLTPEQEEIEKRKREILARAGHEVSARKAATPEAAQIPDSPAGGFSEGSTSTSLSMTGDPQRALYITRVRKRILDEWFLPFKLDDPSLGLNCNLIVRINSRGEVIETVWKKRSGNEAFDLSALRAVQKSSPLEVPPEGLQKEAFYDGFEFEFYPAAKK